MQAQTGPYIEDGKPIARKSVIIFCDILGFKQIVSNWSKDRAHSNGMRRLFDAIGKSFPLVHDPSGAKWIARTISDTIVVAYPYLRDDGLWEFSQACWNALHFQLDLLRSGVVVRGGIGIGEIHMSELLVFPSVEVMNEWKVAERNANYPRMVLLDSAEKYLKENLARLVPEQLRGSIIRDHDRFYFINYLWPLRVPIEGERQAIVKEQKRLIEDSLLQHATDSAIRSKYTWMAQYHNQFCQATPQFTSSEFQVSLT